MTTSISDTGVQFAGGNIINIASTYPTTGSYTQGDIVLEKNTSTQFSGWKRLTTGSNNVLGTDWIYFTGLTLSTAVATTSGTAIDFTGIPSWVKRVTVMLNQVSTSGTSNPMVQIGAGSLVTTGYGGGMWYSSGGASNTNGFQISASSATDVRYGIITLVNMGSNLWSFNVSGYIAGPGLPFVGSGTIQLGGALDRVRLTTAGGTDTFDLGSVNILYEG